LSLGTLQLYSSKFFRKGAFATPPVAFEALAKEAALAHKQFRLIPVLSTARSELVEGQKNVLKDAISIICMNY
jgi:hypothetical protein